MNSYLQSIIEKCGKELCHLTLQDILLCLGDRWGIHSSGYFLEFDDTYGQEHYLNTEKVKYDLTKSPYDQEESVLEFISKNI